LPVKRARLIPLPCFSGAARNRYNRLVPFEINAVLPVFETRQSRHRQKSGGLQIFLKWSGVLESVAARNAGNRAFFKSRRNIFVRIVKSPLKQLF
jgi:hypothetical protein